jgi:hypothetical protein
MPSSELKQTVSFLIPLIPSIMIDLEKSMAHNEPTQMRDSPAFKQQLNLYYLLRILLGIWQHPQPEGIKNNPVTKLVKRSGTR